MSSVRQRFPLAAPAVPLGLMAVLALAALALAGSLYLRRTHVPTDRPDPDPELVVLQLNDTYRLDAVHDKDGREQGGLGRVVALVRQLKKQNKHVLVLHAGDFLAPSLESTQLGSAPMVEALNYLHDIAPVYVVPGNHEFDGKGPELLADALARSRFHWVLSNLERAGPGVNAELSRRAQRSVVVPFRKLKVGIFALSIHGAQGGRDTAYAPLAADYGAVAEAEIARLEEQGADLIVGLTHLDMADDVKLSRHRLRHPRFIWVAGGHEHHWQREAPSDGAALITKGDSNARTVWKVSVLLKGGRPELREERVDVTDPLKPDEKFQREVADYYRLRLRQERPHLDRVIARSPGVCYQASEQLVREEQSNWGSLIADSMRRAHSNLPADVAVLNGGSIRIDDNFCGAVTFEHLERSLAFESPVVLVKLRGKHLKEQVLEHSVAGKSGDGRFLQVSGVRFSFDRGREDGDRVWDVKIQTRRGWEPLREDKAYSMAVPRYLYDCGDGYDFRRTVEEYVPPGPDLRALTYAALADPGAAKRPASPGTVDRIVGVPKYAAAASAGQVKWVRSGAGDRVCPEK